MAGLKLAVAVNYVYGDVDGDGDIYSNEPERNQREEEAEEDGNWSRLDPSQERRWELQQGCRDAHCLCYMRLARGN